MSGSGEKGASRVSRSTGGTKMTGAASRQCKGPRSRRRQLRSAKVSRCGSRDHVSLLLKGVDSRAGKKKADGKKTYRSLKRAILPER